MQNWLWMSACDLGRGIGAGDIDPVALCETYLAAIDAHEYGERIYARSTKSRALAEARAAADRAKAGQRLSLLDGVPISWKDLYDTAGVATEHGSKLLEGRIPDDDAQVLKNATSMGLICLGKTHQTELAFSGLGYNPVTASSPCRNDHDAVSGGSSSGAATSVAFGLAACGIGSDTGGSVRVPSAWNDLVGLKTTAGRVTTKGALPLCPSFDTVGPLCRTVEDAAQMLAILDNKPVADLDGASLSGVRFAVCKTVAFDELDEAVQAGFDSAAIRLKNAGATIDTIELPCVETAMGLAGVLFAPEAYATWADQIEAHPELMFDAVRERFQGGLNFSAVDHIKAWQELEKLRATYLAETAQYDAVLVPTIPILPPKIADCAADMDYFTSKNLMALRNTRIGNLMGLAVLTLPTGLPSVGISFMGAPMSEERLLLLGKAAEDALS